jgi:hypothetical protein
VRGGRTSNSSHRRTRAVVAALARINALGALVPNASATRIFSALAARRALRSIWFGAW